MPGISLFYRHKLAAVNALVMSALALSACQSGGSTDALDSASATPASSREDTALAATTQTDAPTAPQATSVETAEASQAAPQVVAASTPATASQCTMQLAGGPPAKPPRGQDFGQAVAKNVGKSVQRGVIQQIGGAIGGGLGAAVAGGVAQSSIRQEEDIKGVWKITDGNTNCACEISVDSLWKLKGKGADSGFSKNRGCSNATLQSVAAWTLGYSFTGYDSKFQFKGKDKQTVLATLNRDGIHYFSGLLSDGTPIVMWRDGQTYHQLTNFNNSLK